MISCPIREPSKSKWFMVPEPVIKPKLRLYCFPFAGGVAASYLHWKKFMPIGVELCCVQLPGRATRMREPFLLSIHEMAKALAQEVALCGSVPSIFFGHSMGATLAYETLHEVQTLGMNCIKLLAVSGRVAPRHTPEPENIYQLDDDAFLRRVLELNGTPKEIASNEELLQFVMPILRADFEAIETWKPKQQKLLNVPIIAFGGNEDPNVSRDQLTGWSEETQDTLFTLEWLSGDHFFLFPHERSILKSLFDQSLRFKMGSP